MAVPGGGVETASEEARLCAAVPFDSDAYESSFKEWVRALVMRKKSLEGASREFEERYPEHYGEMTARFPNLTRTALVHWTHKPFIRAGERTYELTENWQDVLEEFARVGGCSEELEAALAPRRYPGGYWEGDGWEVMKLDVLRDVVLFGGEQYFLSSDVEKGRTRLEKMDVAHLLERGKRLVEENSGEDLALEHEVYYLTSPEAVELAGETLENLREAFKESQRNGLGLLVGPKVE